MGIARVSRQTEKREERGTGGVVNRGFNGRSGVDGEGAVLAKIVGDCVGIGVLTYQHANAHSAFDRVEVL